MLDGEEFVKRWATGILLVLAWLLVSLLLAGFGYGVTAIFAFFKANVLGSIVWAIIYLALLPFAFGFLAKIIVDWLE